MTRASRLNAPHFGATGTAAATRSECAAHGTQSNATGFLEPSCEAGARQIGVRDGFGWVQEREENEDRKNARKKKERNGPDTLLLPSDPPSCVHKVDSVPRLLVQELGW